MSSDRLVDPVNDDAVPKVDDAVSVGEDLGFQERWWKFEHLVWLLFLLILIADALGVLGRGWLANTKAVISGSSLQVNYERVERTSTPSIMTVTFDPDAVVNNEVHLFASDSLLKELGMQRVIPQPSRSDLGNGGVLYTFPVTGGPSMVRFELQPSSPGVRYWTLQVPGKTPVRKRVVVMP